MNLPRCVTRQILSPVGLIFGSVADVPKRFTNNGDDWRSLTFVLLELCREFKRLILPLWSDGIAVRV